VPKVSPTTKIAAKFKTGHVSRSNHASFRGDLLP